MINLSGRVALITGAASGIGLGIARKLAACGARVAINDLDADGAAAIAAELGSGAFAAAGDVADERSAHEIVTQVVALGGNVDILVNNAGIAQPLVRLTELPVEAWQKVIDVNMRGTFLMSRAVAPPMIDAGAGAIVNIASVAGIGAFPAAHAYGVSKAGVVMMTQTLATELGPRGIRVNCVAPGVIDAPMLDEMAAGEAERRHVSDRVPMGRLGKPEEIGQAVAFLASDAASYVNGAILPVDGGWTAFGGAGPAYRRKRPQTGEGNA